MPYIAENRRKHLENGGRATTTGDLTYLFTKALLTKDSNAVRLVARLQSAVDSYLDGRQESFAIWCDVFGAASCTLFEFERRRMRDGRLSTYDNLLLDSFARYFTALYRGHLAPYEDEKIKQNGDLFA